MVWPRSFLAFFAKPVYSVILTGLSALLLQGCVTFGSAAAPAEEPTLSADSLLSLVQEAQQAYRAEQWANASASYQRLLVALPDDPFAWFRLGNSLTQQGQYTQAILAYEKSLSIDSAQAKPWFNLSTTYLLGAQLATLRAFESHRIDEASRADARQRLDILNALLR